MRISDWNSDVCSSDLQVPSHTHAFAGTAAAANARSAQDSLYAASSANLYAQPDAQVTLAGSTVQDSGSGSPHDNMQPYRTLNFCVALAGVFPSRNQASAGKDRKSVVSGKSVSVRVDLGGSRINKKK